jgi:hemin uptake protein HemP
MMSVPIQPTRRDSSATSAVDESRDAIPTVEVGSIIGAGREAVIVHKGERYRLRVTANDKLILTK